MALMSQHNISNHNGLKLCVDYQGLVRYGNIALLDHFLLSSETKTIFQCFSRNLSKYVFVLLLRCLHLYPTYIRKIGIITVKCLIVCSAPMIFGDLI